jgi:hypothetical protein
MSYAFDYASGQNISFTLPTSVFDDFSTSVICGWWYATTLSANQTLYNAGTTVHMARVNSTTTTTLNVYLDTTGTNGIDQTASALSTGKWLFIGIVFRVWDQGGGNVELDSRTFVGDTTSPPVPLTTSTTTSASGTVVTGTAGTISDASLNEGWEGWAADVSFFTSKTASNLNVLGVDPTIGGIGVERAMNEFFMPIWRGQWDWAWHPSKRGTVGSNGFLLNMPLQNGARSVGLMGTTLNGSGTVNSAVVGVSQVNPRSHVRDLYPPLPNRTNRRMR